MWEKWLCSMTHAKWQLVASGTRNWLMRHTKMTRERQEMYEKKEDKQQPKSAKKAKQQEVPIVHDLCVLYFLCFLPCFHSPDCCTAFSERLSLSLDRSFSHIHLHTQWLVDKIINFCHRTKSEEQVVVCATIKCFLHPHRQVSSVRDSTETTYVHPFLAQKSSTDFFFRLATFWSQNFFFSLPTLL